MLSKLSTGKSIEPTKEDVTFAQQLGVDHFQGYYYGKPALLTD